jgi:hypothetical protein
MGGNGWKSQQKHPFEYMVKHFNKGFNGDYGVKLTLNKFKSLCEVEWPTFGVGWLQKGN